MPKYELKYYGASSLTRKAKEINKIDQEILDLAKFMLLEMRKQGGVGLAAPQVGVSKQLIVIDCGPSYQKEPIFLINPKIIEVQDAQEVQEGCLSFPEMFLPVKRYAFTKVRAMDLLGKTQLYHGYSLLSQCFQHEIEHLHGILYIEHVEDKELLKKELQECKNNISNILKK